MKSSKRDMNRWQRAQKKEQAFIVHHGGHQIIEKSKLDEVGRQRLLSELLNVTQSTVEELKSQKLLEVGGAYYVGIAAATIPDIEAMALDPLIKLYLGDQPDNSDKCRYIEGNAENIQLNDNSIDICICNNAIDHMQSPGQALREIHRVLKTHGKLYISCNIYQNWVRVLFPLFDLADSPHPHHYCHSSFLNMLKINNYQIDSIFHADKINVRSYKSFIGKIFGLRRLALYCSAVGK